MTEQVYQVDLHPEGGATVTEEPVHAAPEEPKQQRASRRQKAVQEEPAKRQLLIAPGLAALGLITVVVVIMTLMSYAQLVMVNDEVFDARSELRGLQTEESKLMAQYELAYDLQEIETQMLSSGQMLKIHSWQTYTLELAEPDSVEYYQSNKLSEKIKALASGLMDSLREYF